MYSAKDRIRFWSKTVVVAGGCIEWRGAAQAGGYGNFYHDGRLKRATHVAWELAYGPLPEVPGADFRGTCVCHRCDNPCCVNFEHLFLGSHADNMRDMDAKGRRVVLRSEDNPRAKLAPEDVAAIRASDRSQRALARIYGVSKSQIGNIKRREQWNRMSQWPEVR